MNKRTKRLLLTEFMAQIKDITKKYQARQKFLDTTFQEISDVEIIEELAKRVRAKPTIKLSMHPNQEYISLEWKDTNSTFIAYLPIEIKEVK